MKLLPALCLAALVALSAAGCAGTPQTVAGASTERTDADRLPDVKYPGLICRAAPGGERCMSRGQWVDYDRQVSNNAQTAADRRGPQSGPTIDGW